MLEANIEVAQEKRRLFLYLKTCPLHVINKFFPGIANSFFVFQPTERIVEYPFIHQNMPLNPDSKNKILDVGSAGSYLPFELASKGYQVWSLDFSCRYNRYISSYNNFTFVEGDIRKTNFPDSFFDFVTGVSVIEHVGLVGKNTSLDDDKVAAREIFRIIKPGGKFLITVPFGKKYGVYTIERGNSFRIYDHSHLEALLSAFKIETCQFAVLKNGSWRPGTLEDVEGIDSLSQARWYSAEAVAMVAAQKPL